MRRVLRSGRCLLCSAFLAIFFSCSEVKPAEKLGGEMIKTGSFPEGSVTDRSENNIADKWLFLKTDPARARYVITNGVCVIILDSPGIKISEVQLAYIPCSLKFGIPYRVSFDAMADSPRYLFFRIGRIGGKGLSYSGLRSFELTSYWQTISFVFRSISSDDSAMLEFDCAKEKPTIYFSNVSMKPILE